MTHIPINRNRQGQQNLSMRSAKREPKFPASTSKTGEDPETPNTLSLSRRTSRARTNATQRETPRGTHAGTNHQCLITRPREVFSNHVCGDQTGMIWCNEVARGERAGVREQMNESWPIYPSKSQRSPIPSNAEKRQDQTPSSTHKHIFGKWNKSPSRCRTPSFSPPRYLRLWSAAACEEFSLIWPFLLTIGPSASCWRCASRWRPP